MKNIKLDEPISSEIILSPNGNDWAIKIGTDGIKFNREFYSSFTPDNFVEIFMAVLERNFKIKFIEK